MSYKYVCVHLQSSSVYPLFKPGASSLGGACLAAHVTIQPCLSLLEVNAATCGCRTLINVNLWIVQLPLWTLLVCTYFVLHGKNYDDHNTVSM